MNTISNNIIKLLTIASTILVLASCGSSDSGSSGATGFSATVVAARVTNASCTATVVANGTRTTTVAATSNANGSVFFSTSNTGNTLIECSGGTYTDEATGATNTFVTGTLTAAVNAQSGGEYVVSPLSSLAWLRAGQNPVLIDQVINTFNTEVGRQFGLGTATATADVTTLIPTDLAAPNAVIDPDNLNDQYAVALAVVSQIGVNTGNTDTAAVTNHLAGMNTTTNDIRDLIATALTDLEASSASAVASVIDATATATIRMNNTNTVAINSITLPATSTVTIGSTITVQATASPAEAVDTSVVYSSSNPAIASVDTNTGVVTGIADGTAIITATANDNPTIIATINITAANPLTGTFSYPAVNTTTFNATGTFSIDNSSLNTSGVISYRITSSPVSGISVDANTGAVSADASLDAGNYATTVEASSTRGGTATASIDITIGRAPLNLEYNNNNPIQHSISAGTLDLSDSSLYPLTGNLGNGAITYSITNNNANIGSITPAGIFTPQGTNIGTATLVVEVAATTNYLAGSTTLTLDITALPPNPGSLSFINQTPSTTFDDGVFMQAVTNNNATGAITYRSSNTNIATVDNSGTVTFVTAGTVDITATAAGDSGVASTSASYTLVIDRVNQMITNTTPTTATFSVGGTLTATARSNQASATGAVSVIASTRPEFVSFLPGSNQLNIIGGGSSTITVQKAQDERYNLATTTFTLTVDRANQMVEAGPDQTRTFDAANFTQAATGNITSLTYTSSNPNVAAVNDLNGEVIIGRVGSTIINVTATETDDYNKATDSYSITVERAPLMLVYNNNNPIQRSVMAAGTLDLSDSSLYPLTGNLGNGTITYSIINNTNNIGTITPAGIFTPEGSNIGSATLVVEVAQTNNYLAGSVTTTLGIFNLRPQSPDSLTFSIATRTITVLADNFTQPADINGGVGTLTYSSSQPTVATVNMQTGEVDVQAIGQSVISAQLSGDATFAPSSPARYTLSVIRETQTINAGPNQTRTFGAANFTQSATGNITPLTYSSNNTAVATVDANGAVTIGDAGRAVITATAPQDERYNLATDTYQVVVNRADQMVEAGPDQTRTFGAANFTQSATGNITPLTYSSNNTAVATVDANGVVTIGDAGSAVITATAPESTNYNQASDSYSITVEQAPLMLVYNGGNTIIHSISALTSLNLDDFDLMGNSGNGVITYSIINNNNNIGTTTPAGIFTPQGTNTGNATLVASVAETTNYLAGSTTVILDIIALPQQSADSLTFARPMITVEFDGLAVANSQTVTNNGAVGDVTYRSSNTDIATVNNSGTVTFIIAGTVDIIATAAGDNTVAPISARYTLVINRSGQSLSLQGGSNGSFPLDTGPITAEQVVLSSRGAAATGALTIINSDNRNVIQISNNQLILVGVGTSNVTFEKAQDARFETNRATFILTVTEAQQMMSPSSSPSMLSISLSPSILSITPTGGLVGVDGDQVSLEWDEVANAQHYTVYYQTRTLTLYETDNGGVEASNLAQMTTATTTATTFTTPTLDGNRYYFVVSATVGGTQSLTSNQRDVVPFASVENAGGIWMSRNLGAIRDCTAINDSQCFGNLYQWGRAADGHQLIDRSIPGNCFDNAGTSVVCTDASVAQNILSGSITVTIDPAEFIADPSADWTASGVDDDGALRAAAWADGGVNDICPAGYVVPTIEQFIQAYNHVSDTSGFESSLKLPTSSTRLGSNAVLVSVLDDGDNVTGQYWVSQVSDGSSFARAFNSRSGEAVDNVRDTGLSVRCIQNTNY